MAEGEHLSEQTRNLWLSDKPATPLEGTEKHPQGRLFNPSGRYTGDPMRLHPENWLKQSETPAHGDTISWHASEESSLPRSDEYEHRQLDPSMHEGADWDNVYEEDEEGNQIGDYTDFSVDAKERPMTEYGSAVGLHFGSLAAASERAPRPFMHPARLPESTMVPPPRGGFSTAKPGGAFVSGSYRSDRDIVNSQTGERTPDERWSDVGANYADKATDLVEEGKTLAYRNDVEARGSTSFRTLPETARTWSEDVMSATDPSSGHLASKYGWSDDTSFRNKPHPALVHLAEKGYDPVVLRADSPKPVGFEPMQMSFGDLADEEYQVVNKMGQREQPLVNERKAAFDAGRTWTMRKPTS